LNKSVYIIVCAYNEAPTIEQTITSLLQNNYSVIIVDDASNDGTGEIVQKYPVHYLRHSINMGQGAALQTGIEYALSLSAEVFVTFDADGQHDCKDISPMINQLKLNELDIIFGSRFLQGATANVSFFRRTVLRSARYFNCFLAGILLTDAHNGLRVFNRKAAIALKIIENRMAHASEILIQVKANKLKYAEHPVHIFYSDYSIRKGQKLVHGFKIIQDLFLYKLFK